MYEKTDLSQHPLESYVRWIYQDHRKWDGKYKIKSLAGGIEDF